MRLRTRLAPLALRVQELGQVGFVGGKPLPGGSELPHAVPAILALAQAANLMSDHLFAEMDAIVDALRANDPTLRDSLSDKLQLEFKQLQEKRMPQLGKAEFLDLFHTWRDHYLTRLEAELAATHKRMAENDCRLAALIAERDRRNPAANQFVCKCSEVIVDPLDPEQMRIHQPHFQPASLPQVHEALERWRDYARRTIQAASDLSGEAR